MHKTEESWAAVDRATSNSSGLKNASTSASDLAGSASDATAGLRDLAKEMEELTGPALNAAEAQIRVEEAIDRATESIRKNGHTLDVHTEKGRANREAVLEIAQAAQKHISSMQEEGASTEAIANAYGRYRGQLYRTLRQASATRDEARMLTDEWMRTPESVTTAVKANISDLEGKVAAAKARLRDPKLTRPEKARIRAEIAQLQAQVAAAKRLLASLHDKTVHITTVRTEQHEFAARASWHASGGIIGGLGGVRKFAQGGVSGSGSLAMVGEQGPELVNLPVGSTVTPAGQTRAMQQGGFGDVSMAFRSASGGGAGDSVSSMRDLTRALREVISLREGMSHFTDSVFGQSRALIAYEAAWDNIKKSIKENGKTLNISKEKVGA